MKITASEEKEIKEVLSKWEIRYKSASASNEFYITFREIAGPHVKSWNRTTISLSVTYSPTGNCQLFSICNFDNLYKFLHINSMNDKIYRIMIQNIFQLIEEKYTAKRVVFLDVRNDRYKTFRKTIKNFSNFVPSYSFTYKSTNGSKMRSCIVKIDQNKTHASRKYLSMYKNLKEGDYSTFS